MNTFKRFRRENITVDRSRFELESTFRMETIERVRNMAKADGPREVILWGKMGKGRAANRVTLMKVINHTNGPWPEPVAFESPLKPRDIIKYEEMGLEEPDNQLRLF